MNLEIKTFKNKIKKIDLKSELGFYFFKEKIINENTKNEFFTYELKNNLNKRIQFVYYSCNRPIISNEITVILIYANGGTTSLSNFLAYKQLKRKLTYEEISPYLFKVDCKNVEQSIQFQLQKILDFLLDDFKKYILTEESFFIPMYDPRDDY